MFLILKCIEILIQNKFFLNLWYYLKILLNYFFQFLQKNIKILKSPQSFDKNTFVCLYNLRSSHKKNSNLLKFDLVKNTEQYVQELDAGTSFCMFSGLSNTAIRRRWHSLVVSKPRRLDCEGLCLAMSWKHVLKV